LASYASSFDCIGIFARHVDDVARVLEVVAGADDQDSTVSRRNVNNYSGEVEQTAGQKFRVAYMRDTIENNALQPEIRNEIVKKIAQLKDGGHHVQAVDFPLNEYVLPTYYILATAEASSNLSRYDGIRYGVRSEKARDISSLYKKTRSESFGREVQRRILLGTFVLSSNYYDAYYSKAQKVRRLIRDEIKKLFLSFDFILMPTTPSTAFKLGEHSDNPLEMYLADLFSVQANVAGVPAISIPCGTDQLGLPIGLQLMGDDFEEGKLLGFSKTILEMN
jgi:aspartyl-tRNA(Asn)/glutamyl-tRNA(Gln) amidotransferase subunit A